MHLYCIKLAHFIHSKLCNFGYFKAKSTCLLYSNFFSKWNLDTQFFLLKLCFGFIFQIIIQIFFFKTVKKIITKVDLFSSIQLLRFEGEAQTKTFTGGLISFAILIYMFTTLSTMISDIFNKLVITSTQDTTQAKQPTPIYLQTTDNASHFMLGVEIWNLDLTTGPRYFDIEIKNIHMANDKELNTSIQYTLQPCTKQHWQAVPNISYIYDKIQMNRWLCIRMNISFVLQGKYSSDLQTSLNIVLKKCNNDTDPLRPCASQSQIDDFFTLNTLAYFSPYFINTLINPQNKEYLSLYLQDRYYTVFAAESAMEMYLYNAEYKVTTDQSILPFSQKHSENGSILTAVYNNAFSLGKSEIYAYINFYRDASTFFVTRSYQTIEDALSFVGGLLGSFILVLVFINFYNECSFQMKFVTIYKVQPDSPNTTKNFNFMYYILQGIYNLLTIIKIKCNKPNSIKYFHQTRQEMIKQLDVKYLFRKLHVLQNAMMLILTEPQIKGLMLQYQMTIDEAKRMRKIYGTKRRLKKHFTQKLKEKHQNIDIRDDSMVNINMDLIYTTNKKDNQPQITNQIPQNSKEIQRPSKASFSQNSLKKIQTYLSSQSGQQSSQSSSNQSNCQVFAEKIIKDLKALKSKSRKSHISKTLYRNLDPLVKHIFKIYDVKSKEVVQQNTIQKNLQYGTRQLLQYKQTFVNPVQSSLENFNKSKQKEQMVFQFIQDQDN